MVKAPKKFVVGDRIFAKVRGYPPWPAKIESITDPNTKNSKYHVIFYGTGEIGTCKIEDLSVYVDNKEKFSKTVRRKYFHEGIQELEDDLRQFGGIPNSSSEQDDQEPETSQENLEPEEPDAVLEAVAAVHGMDSDAELGSLIIDEGDKKKAAMKRKNLGYPTLLETPETKKKRGRKSLTADLSSRQETSADSQDEDASDKKVSRSGRKIKPKRFHDFSEAEVLADTPKNDQGRGRVKSKVDDSIEGLEVPSVGPPKKRTNVEKDDKRANQKAENVQAKQQKLRWLRIESQLLTSDTHIRSSLGLDQANTDECLQAMDVILNLSINPLMLKKHSHIVETVKRLRRYIGNLSDWKLTEEEVVIFKQKAEQIRQKAELIYAKFKTMFTVPDSQTFWQTFSEQVNQFKEATKDMSEETIFSLMTDPSVTDSSSVLDSSGEGRSLEEELAAMIDPPDAVSQKSTSMSE